MKKGPSKPDQKGFTYIEVMIAIVILLVGILAQLSALSLSMLREKEAEQQSMARQIASSTLESIFAARDLAAADGISSWDKINTSDVNSSGLFVPGWMPVRSSGGKDGIQGTADDACTDSNGCTVGNYTNSSLVVIGYDRKIIITNVQENGTTNNKKKRIEVKIQYFVGQLRREQSLATIIADLPFSN